MDLYERQLTPDFSTQVHDFDPGISPYPDGLFWTVRRPSDSVEVDLEEGSAKFDAEDLRLFDFFNVPNALFHPPIAPAIHDPVSVGAKVSFDIDWSGPIGARSDVVDPTNGFRGSFVQTAATVRWSAENDLGFSFESDAEGITTVLAELGQMRNGVFFHI